MAPHCIAVIPARGGSARLPRKNVLEFCGRPIIAWTIEAARASNCFARVLVSTEDAEIAAVSGAEGAEVLHRVAALSTDRATVVEVCADVLAREESAGRAYDVLCCLYPTAPLRDAADIRAVIALVERGVCDFALAVTEYSHPPHQALRLQADGTAMPMWPDLVARRADELGPLVVDNGSTYAATVPAFRSAGHFFGSTLRVHRMPRSRSVDIDHAEDLDLARYYAQQACA